MLHSSFEKTIEVVFLWKRFAAYCTGYLLSRFHDTTCGILLCGNDNPKSSDSRHAWLWQPQTRRYCQICTEVYHSSFSTYTGPQSNYTERKIKRGSLSGFMIVQSSGKNILGLEIVLRRRMICVKKQGDWSCLLKNLDKECRAAKSKRQDERKEWNSPSGPKNDPEEFENKNAVDMLEELPASGQLETAQIKTRPVCFVEGDIVALKHSWKRYLEPFFSYSLRGPSSQQWWHLWAHHAY